MPEPEIIIVSRSIYFIGCGLLSELHEGRDDRK